MGECLRSLLAAAKLRSVEAAVQNAKEGKTKFIDQRAPVTKYYQIKELRSLDITKSKSSSHQVIPDQRGPVTKYCQIKELRSPDITKSKSSGH